MYLYYRAQVKGDRPQSPRLLRAVGCRPSNPLSSPGFLLPPRKMRLKLRKVKRAQLTIKMHDRDMRLAGEGQGSMAV